MQLSPTYRAILRVIPDLSWIYNFKEALGRGRCPWVYGLTKAGHRVARFIKKGLIGSNVWLNDSEYVSLHRNRLYTVTQDKCTCPEWRHRISQGKGYRHIPGLFKGYVDRCKHQVQQWFNHHDASQFSSYIDINPERYNVIKLSETAAPQGISFTYQEEGYPVLCFDVYLNRNCIGEITENSNDFEVSTPKSLNKTFQNQNDAINWLIKQHELSAARDLFGDEMYPETEPEPQPKKQQKRWLNFSGLSGFKQQVISNDQEEINLLGDYGNWLEPDPAWDEHEEF